MDIFPWGCSRIDPPPSADIGFKPLPGMEEVAKRWKAHTFVRHLGRPMNQRTFIQSDDRAEAVRRCAAAVAVIKVGGGYLCFESIDDYRAWANSQSKPEGHEK
jgi:hypothetical protein